VVSFAGPRLHHGADSNKDAKGGVKSPEFLRINENGRVPALEDPNTPVTSWESGACVNYLVRVYDKQNQLGPRGNSEQDHVDYDKWIFFLATTLGPMVGQVKLLPCGQGGGNKRADISRSTGSDTIMLKRTTML